MIVEKLRSTFTIGIWVENNIYLYNGVVMPSLKIVPPIASSRRHRAVSIMYFWILLVTFLIKVCSTKTEFQPNSYRAHAFQFEQISLKLSRIIFNAFLKNFLSQSPVILCIRFKAEKFAHYTFISLHQTLNWQKI